MAHSWWMRVHRRRARRALERQLDYQKHFAVQRDRNVDAVRRAHEAKAAAVGELFAHRALPDAARVLEIGNGARGLIFHVSAGRVLVGADPLAVDYSILFPAASHHFRRCAAFGEHLPFGEETFDVVICDNVIDHAEDPAAILREAVRVLRTDGLLYFTVNVHHRLYQYASIAHGLLNGLGIGIEVSAFADHTVHLSVKDVRGMMKELPLRVLEERDSVETAKHEARTTAARHLGDHLKRVFFKNARYVTIARKQSNASRNAVG